MAKDDGVLMRLAALAMVSMAVMAEAATVLNADGDLDLLILHNNDMHARFEEVSRTTGTCQRPGSCYGGFGRVAHVVRQARAAAAEGRGPAVLYLNAGDTYTGTSWFGVHKWKIAAAFLNALKPDAASLGNHEFDTGIDGLIPLLKSANFPIVTCNLDLSNEIKMDSSPLKKSVILQVAGRQIGIVGYLTTETSQLSNTGNLNFQDEIVAITAEAQKLRELGVKTIIALGHSGFKMDQKIAAEVPLVDVVVGGHTNTFLWNGPEPDIEVAEGPYPKVVTQPSGKKVPVVQAYAYTKYMGRLNITLDSDGRVKRFSGQPLLLDSSVPQEDDMIELLKTFRPQIEALKKMVLGKTKVLLDGSAETCRNKECNLGNLITDATVAFLAVQYGGMFWSSTPIAIHNGGGIRNSISIGQDGNVSQSDILSVLPFDNKLLTLDVYGSDIMEILEWSVHTAGEISGGQFLQVSGLKVIYDIHRPKGQRVLDVKLRCGHCSIPDYEPLDPKKVYRLALYSFIADGGDGYTTFKKKAFNKVVEEIGDIDVLSWYMKRQLIPVYPGIEGRITYVGDDKVKLTPSSSTLIKANWFVLVIALYQLFKIR